MRPSSQRRSFLRPALTRREASLDRVRQLGMLLDNAITIPGTTYKIGLDPLLGLVPGAGDVAGTMLSAYIVLEAARLGVPKATIGRMVVNLLTDAALGALPVLGDWFDFAWKANSRNLELLEAHMVNASQQGRRDRGFILVLALGLGLLVLAVAAFTTVVGALILNAVQGR
jgi:hypothetical protein